MAETYVFYHLTRPAAVLRATGPDAFAFLQSQFSNDLKNPGVEQPVTYGLWLDHKGKIQSDSFVLEKSPENFLLVSYDCHAALLRLQLESRLVADEVTLSDETSEFGLLHVWAEVARDEFPKFRRSALAGGPAKLPEIAQATFDDFQAHMEGLADPATCESWMGRRPGPWSWDFLASPEVLTGLVRELVESGVEAADAEHLNTARIVVGVPSVPQDAGPGDFPQETRLDGAAVSFDKGCYLGQEIMSRLHTQGHVNRGLWQVAWEGVVQLPPNTEPVPLYAGGVEAGELRSRVTTDDQGLGLAMLKQRVVAGQRTLSFSPNGPSAVQLVKDLTAI